MNQQVLVDRDERGVATITLNRAEKHNAFDDGTIAALTRELLAVEREESVRAVVLTGAGKSFSSGADLAWMRSVIGYSEEQNRDDALRLAELLQALDELRKPTIARVNGAAIGGGVGLAAACDIALASDHAKFALSEVRLGLVPAVIAPYVIAAIGAREARRYFLTGEVMNATTAARIGLVHQSVPHEQLDATVDLQLELLLQGGPQAQHEAKALVALVTREAELSPRQLRERTAELIARLRVSDEGQEGLNAFLQKRRPNWRLR